jgi:hypothetical protein
LALEPLVLVELAPPPLEPPLSEPPPLAEDDELDELALVLDEELPESEFDDDDESLVAGLLSVESLLSFEPLVAAASLFEPERESVR